MNRIAARRYSEALFEAGKQEEGPSTYFQLERLLEEMKDVSSIMLQNNELMEFFTHPNIRMREKKNMIENIFGGKISEEIIILLKLLIKHERLNELKIVYYEFKDIVNEFRGVKEAAVITAVEMSPDEAEKLRRILEEKYICKIQIKNTVNSELLGGVYLRVGDDVIDGTVRNRLQIMEKELLADY